MIARLPPVDAARSEADAEAVLMALGQVARPAPKVMVAPEVLDAIIQALRGPFRLRMRYRTPDAPPRIVEPHGLLRGHRSYLVARQPDRSEGCSRQSAIFTRASFYSANRFSGTSRPRARMAP